MKILALGDFHGEFPQTIKDIIRKNKIDVVLSNGDYFPFHYRELWFKHCYGKDTELWEVIGKSKYKKMILKDLKLGEKSLRGLNSLKVPVFTTVGNLDYSRYNDQYHKEVWGRGKWNWDNQDFFSNIIRKYPHVKRVNYKQDKIGEYAIIGAIGGSNSGVPESKSFKRHLKLLIKMFKNNKDRSVIFLSHNVPNNTKLDKASMKAHKAVRGKHLGSKLVRMTIDKCRPLIHIGGHMHEGRGIQKVGKTLCVNPGAVHDGEAAIIELNGRSVKAKLIRI